MADRIKGITIEIGGDTSKLQSSLKGVDKQLRETQSNLKDINKLLKLLGNNPLLYRVARRHGPLPFARTSFILLLRKIINKHYERSTRKGLHAAAPFRL